MPITVVCALIIRNDTVLCAQRSEQMALPLKWEFPGGKLLAKYLLYRLLDVLFRRPATDAFIIRKCGVFL